MCNPERSRASYLLSLAGFALLAGCGPNVTRAPSTPAEELDETRVVLAVAEAVRRESQASVCVRRMINAAPAWDALPAIELAKMRTFIRTRPRQGANEGPRPRMLDDAAIRAAGGAPAPGSSCAGLIFMTFMRVQFRANEALAFASADRVAACGRGALTFRLRRSNGSWAVIDRIDGHITSPTSCENSGPITRPDYFGLTAQGGSR
jgi:hypothetical protein